MRVGHAFVKREVILRNKNIYTEDKKTPDKIIKFIKENFVIIKEGIVIIKKRKQKDTTNTRESFLLTITSSLLLLSTILFIIFLYLLLLFLPFFPLSQPIFFLSFVLLYPFLSFCQYLVITIWFCDIFYQINSLRK